MQRRGCGGKEFHNFHGILGSGPGGGGRAGARKNATELMGGLAVLLVQKRACLKLGRKRGRINKKWMTIHLLLIGVQFSFIFTSSIMTSTLVLCHQLCWSRSQWGGLATWTKSPWQRAWEGEVVEHLWLRLIIVTVKEKNCLMLRRMKMRRRRRSWWSNPSEDCLR